MENPIENYWHQRLHQVKTALESNNFQVHIAPSPQDAGRLALEEIIPATGAKRLSWGGSMTFLASGLYKALLEDKRFELIDTFDKNLSKEEGYQRRRQSLLCDLYITGTNAITEDGQLVNLDMIGNRVGAINFGPKDVVLMVGRNKIVPDLEAAFDRIKDYAAPTNTMRLDKKNPCAKTSRCEECKSPERICNIWTITEKSFPKGRIKVILINADAGL
jgi:L-lactate utilization protein LutB